MHVSLTGQTQQPPLSPARQLSSLPQSSQGVLVQPAVGLPPKSQILSGLETADAELTALAAKLSEIRVKAEEQGTQLVCDLPASHLWSDCTICC